MRGQRFTENAKGSYFYQSFQASQIQGQVLSLNFHSGLYEETGHPVISWGRYQLSYLT